MGLKILFDISGWVMNLSLQDHQARKRNKIYGHERPIGPFCPTRRTDSGVHVSNLYAAKYLPSRVPNNGFALFEMTNHITTENSKAMLEFLFG